MASLVCLAGELLHAPVAILRQAGGRQWPNNGNVPDLDAIFGPLGDVPLVIADARAEKPGRGDLGMLVGLPLIADGIVLGGLWIADHDPRTPDENSLRQAIAVAETLAQVVRLNAQAATATERLHEVEGVLGSVTSIMIVVKPDGRIERWNAGAEATLGVEATAAIGQTLQDLEIDWDVTALTDAMASCLQSDTPVRVDDLELNHPVGRRLLGIQASPVSDGSDRVAVIIQGADITARREAEIELREQQARYRNLVDHVSDAVVQLDVDGRLTFVNRAWLSITGLSPEESLGGPLFRNMSEYDVERGTKLVASLVRKELSSCVIQAKLQRSQEDARWIEFYLQPMKDEAGNIVGVSGTLVDLTERMRADEETRDRHRFERMLTSLSTGLICPTVDQALEAVNQALAAICENLRVERGALYSAMDNGHFKLAAEYRSPGAIGLPESREEFSLDQYPYMASRLRSMQAVLITSAEALPPSARPEQERMRLMGLGSKIALPLHVDGRLRGFITFGDREPTSGWPAETVPLLKVVAAMFANVFERIRAEQSLAALSQRMVDEYRSQLHTVITSAPIILFAIDMAGTCTLCEGKGLEAIDLKPGHLIGKKFTEICSSTFDLDECLLRAAKESFMTEISIARVPFETHFSPVRNEQGQCEGVIGVAINISDRLQFDHDLRLRDRAIAAARNGIVIVDALRPDLPIIYANEMFHAMTGYGPDETYGRNCRFLQGDDKEQPGLHQLREAVQTGSECHVMLRNYRKNGDMFWNELTLYPIRDSDGLLTNFVGVQNDVTEQRSLQAQLGHAQKMESVGQLAAGIAHEINTPMQYIDDNARFLRRSFGSLVEFVENSLLAVNEIDANSAERLREIAEQIDLRYLLQEIPISLEQSLDGIGRVTRIVQALKEFSHPGTIDFVELDINRAIDSTVTVARNEWKYVANVRLSLAEGLPLVPCLPGDFNQVILNLVVNAAQSIADRVELGDYEKGEIHVQTSLDDDHLVVSISDNGNGIPEKVAGQVFNPFFTTKEVGKGSGQGLAISRTIIVDKHHGSIAFSSAPGQGTTFTVRIPLQQDSTCGLKPLAA